MSPGSPSGVISIASSWMFLEMRLRANRPNQPLFLNFRLSPWVVNLGSPRDLDDRHGVAR